MIVSAHVLLGSCSPRQYQVRWPQVEREVSERIQCNIFLHAKRYRDHQVFACLCMPGRGRKLVAIQTEAHEYQHCDPHSQQTSCTQSVHSTQPVDGMVLPGWTPLQ